MKLTHLLPLLALTACAAFDTKEERYFAMVGFVKATGDIAEAYVDACRGRAEDHPCREKFPRINAAAKALKDASAQADRVFVSKDSEFYDASLTAAENAAMALRKIIKE